MTSRERALNRLTDLSVSFPKRISLSILTKSMVIECGSERHFASSAMTQTLIPLSEDLRQVEGKADDLSPTISFESEFRRCVLDHWWQLKEISCYDDLGESRRRLRSRASISARLRAWIPPKGFTLLRKTLATASSLSNRSASTIEISSRMRHLVRCHRVTDFLFLLILFTIWSTGSMHSPAPLKLCRVTPPILQAAIPVDAVTATASADWPRFPRRLRMISRKRTDFPVPYREMCNVFSYPRSRRLREALTCATSEKDVLSIEDLLQHVFLLVAKTNFTPNVQAAVQTRPSPRFRCCGRGVLSGVSSSFL